MLISIPLLIIALAAGFVVCFVPGYFYRIAIRRRNEPVPPPSWFDTQGCGLVSIRSFDGLLLRGRYVPAAGGISADTVILAHGYRGNGAQMENYARLFYENHHCNLLLPDARGHGLSEGDYAGFGWHERLDYLRWIDWVKERTVSSGGTARIVLFGVSMGAATVMMTAGEELPAEVKALIEDCGYTSAAEELAYQLKRTYHISSPWLLKTTSRLTQKRHGYSFEEASCLEQLKKSSLPALFIHGDADTFVPFNMVFPLHDASPGEKELYIVKGAGHAQAYETDGDEYRNRVIRFLKKYLPQGDPRSGHEN